ncbi:MAG: NAD(P)H-dependent oxidoreductase [Bifidobacteriaceae bacterium]|jgi:nitroreductase|nr:NAD(P)H-dependent oxidoreductase [Bifidobacteriaceae bacterium]
MTTPTAADAHAHARQATLAAFRSRRATKAFDPARTIPDDDVDFLFEIARLSPTSHGLEPFRILVLADRQLRADLVAKAGGVAAQMVDASHLLAITANTAAAIRPDSVQNRHVKVEVQGLPESEFGTWCERFGDFLSTRYGAWGNERAMFDWAARQAYIVLGNLMTAGAMIGIDSCALEGMVYAEADAILADAGAIDPATERLAVMVALGYRLGEPHRPAIRRPLADVVRTIGSAHSGHRS